MSLYQSLYLWTPLKVVIHGILEIKKTRVHLLLLLKAFKILCCKVIEIQCNFFSVSLLYSFIAKQVKYVLEKFHVYTLGNGRINMCNVTTSNVEHVAKAFDDTVRNVKE